MPIGRKRKVTSASPSASASASTSTSTSSKFNIIDIGANDGNVGSRCSRIAIAYVVDAAADEPPRKRKRLNFPVRSSVGGQVLVCGQGDMGQLGLGDTETMLVRKFPTPLALSAAIKTTTTTTTTTTVVDVRAGGMHSLLLTDDGRVFSFGCNDEGALGRNIANSNDNNDNNRKSNNDDDDDEQHDDDEFHPGLVALPGRALKLSAGDSHSACLLEDGRVFAWGSFRDSHGSMGLTIAGCIRTPVHIFPHAECCDIASGADHLLLLAIDGIVYTMGCDEQGQLGRPASCGENAAEAMRRQRLLEPIEISTERCRCFDAIWATNYSSFMRESRTGHIWSFGLNNYRQLMTVKDTNVVSIPSNTKFTNVRKITGGQHHTLLLTRDGQCYAIGRHDYGRLGFGRIHEDVTCLRPIEAFQQQQIVNIDCGEAQSFAIVGDIGQLYAWGMGTNYQLGNGKDDDLLEPMPITSRQIVNRRVLQISSGGQHTLILVKT